jgi:beta-xylosidase
MAFSILLSLVSSRPTAAGTQSLIVSGRETLLLPVVWDDDWPIFNNREPVRLQQDVPAGYVLKKPVKWRDDFSSSEMTLGWYRKSKLQLGPNDLCISYSSMTDTPVKVDFKLAGTPRHLELYGGPWNLSTPAAPTMFLRKQTTRQTLWTTQLNYQPDSTRTEAGTVVWWNYFTYSSIGIRRSSSGSRFVRYRPAAGDVADFPLQTKEADVFLFIDCHNLEYRLGFVELLDVSSGLSEKDNATWVGAVSTDIMTRDPEVGAAFTGMMLGLYAFGELEPCLTPAVFRFAAFE